MTGAEAFVMTSLSEGFGLTTAEAMLNRCLVIARNTAGSKEQLDRGFALTGSEIGLRFDTYTQLASHLHSIESEKNASIFESMKVHAFNTVDELYTVGSYASKVEEFYNKVLRSSNL
jgi:glycosyltransferase involved in cell wall biosynthesis